MVDEEKASESSHAGGVDEEMGLKVRTKMKLKANRTMKTP